MTADPSAPPVPPALIGVGMGPGDPDLVTVRAADLLAKADVVFVPVADPQGTGRAEQTALYYAEAWRVERVVFAPHDPGHRGRAWDAAVAAVAGWFAAHPAGVAAFATIGDPGVYSAFPRFAESVRGLVGDLDVRLVPGITAMQELAARTGIPLVQAGEALHLVSTGGARLREACERGDGVVAHKCGGLLPEVLAVLGETGRLDDAVYAAGGQVRRARDLDPAATGPYLSTLLVPPARSGS
jgi:precorrin-2/cobalt-factor-2 C20-methyltransferase